MTDKLTLPVFIVVNEDGQYEVGTTADEAGERLADNYTSYRIRCVRLDVTMALPKIEDGPAVDVPDTAGTTQDMEVEAA